MESPSRQQSPGPEHDQDQPELLEVCSDFCLPSKTNHVDRSNCSCTENDADVVPEAANREVEKQPCSGGSADGEEESSLDSCGEVGEGSEADASLAAAAAAGAKDPFAPECKIPLPVTFAPFDYDWVEPSFIRKRNERERQRVRNVNDGFERLRSHLPLLSKSKDRRLSKVSRVETLRYAISYIRHLQGMLND